MTHGTSSTASIARRSAGLRVADIPAGAMERARHCLLDCLGTAIGGADEPVAAAVRRVEQREGGPPTCTIVGTDVRLGSRQAALVNGAAAHALDFDDNCAWMLGHPSAAIVPAVLAVAEREGASLEAVLAAIVAGVDAGARIGQLLGTGHYDAGWHGTGTMGTFGATAACSHLLGLDGAATETAFGLAAGQASGLKAVFGTMGKPLNAAKAATNGVLSADLAAGGVTAPEGILEAPNGFAAVVGGTLDPARVDAVIGASLGIEGVTHKFHASCAGTHPTIDNLRALRDRHGFAADDVDAVVVRVPEPLLAVCAQPRPTTGLAGKFSLTFTASLVLAGRSTDRDAFVDGTVGDPVLRSLVERVQVTAGDDDRTHHVEVKLRGGTTLTAGREMEAPVPDAELPDQWARLVAKFTRLVTPVIGEESAGRVVAGVAGGGPEPVARLLSATTPRAPQSGRAEGTSE